MHSGGPLGKPAGNTLQVLLLLASSVSCFGGDWPQYRGPNHDGVSADRIVKQWTGAVTNPVWRVGVSNCLGSLAVAGGRVFTQTRRTIGGVSNEVCVALSVTNGEELWARTVESGNNMYTGGVGPDDGPRTTPAVDGDSVFVLTSYIKLYRLNVTNGAVITNVDLRTVYGGDVIGWQNAASPVIEDGLIYLNANCSNSTTLMALRTSDLGVAWRAQQEGMTHSTPILATIHGVRQVIFATTNGLVALEPNSGSFIWRHDYPFTYGSSLSVSPVVHEDMVFICGAQAYEMGSLAIRIGFDGSTWTATELWKNVGVFSTLSSHWMTPVAHDGFLYGQFGVQSFDSPTAQLKCVDMRTGSVKWSVNGYGRGATIMVDGNLVTITERGDLVLSVPNTNSYTQLGRLAAITNYNSGNRCWNGPAVADGRIYVRSTSYVACFDLSVPALKLDTPEPTGPGQLRLTIRTANGTPIDAGRAAGVEVRASEDPALGLDQWLLLPNTPVLNSGVLRIENVDSTATPQKYYIVREPQ